MNLLVTSLLICFSVAYARDSPIKRLVCSNNEQIRTSVLQCLKIVPSSFSESVENCNPGIKVNGDYAQWLTYFCGLNDAKKKESENCVKKKIREKGESIIKIAMPLLKCLQNINA